MAKKHGIEVQCVTCKKTRLIDRTEAAELSARQSIPMCDGCCMPMVAKRAFA